MITLQNAAEIVAKRWILDSVVLDIKLFLGRRRLFIKPFGSIVIQDAMNKTS